MGNVAEAWCLIGSLALSLGACASTGDEAYDDIDLEFRTDDGGALDLGLTADGGEETEARSGRPGGDDDDWLSNGLEDPDVSGVDPAYGLNTPQGMSDAGEVLDDPALRGTAEYIVECALPAGHSITKTVNGQPMTFYGHLGLAPEWETGACDVDCQEWVTACLLASTNVSAMNVSIWVQATHEAIGLGAPEGALLEAAFYGNLFADPNAQYMCKGSGDDIVAAKREGRTCSQANDCGFTTYSNCTSHDRCTLVGENSNVPSDCKSGNQATSAPYHTIATYVVPEP